MIFQENWALEKIVQKICRPKLVMITANCSKKEISFKSLVDNVSIETITLLESALVLLAYLKF